MNITIRNFCGVEAVNLTASPIALLAGLNGAGKSSTLAAIAAALTGQLLPSMIAKKDAAQLVRDGADAGKATVTDGEGRAEARWPGCERSIEGSAPRASMIAAGGESIIDMDSKTAAQVLAKYLKTEPTQAELAAYLRDSDSRFATNGAALTGEPELMRPLGLDPQDQRDVAIYRMVAKMWPEIEVNGFDGGHRIASDEGAQLKGAWRQVAGEAYGSQKATGWTHKDSALAESIVPQGKDAVAYLETEIADRKRAVESAIRAATVAAVNVDQLKAIAAGAAGFEDALNEANADVAQARFDATSIVMPTPLYEPLTCPHCGCGVEVGSDGQLMQATHEHSAEAVAANQAAIVAARAAAEEVEQRLTEARTRALAAQASMEEAQRAQSRLSSLDLSASGEQDVETAKARLSAAEKALAAVRSTSEAGRIHRQIIGNQALIDALSPDGLRKTKLGRVLEAFNEAKLLPLCEAAGWPRVEIDASLRVRFGGRPAREPFVSESQVMRARIVLQVAMAQLDGSACILIDRADRLDQRGRNGLFGLLKAADVKAVVAMTMNKPDLLPDLARAGLGNAYWLSAGVSTPRADALRPVAQAAE